MTVTWSWCDGKHRDLRSLLLPSNNLDYYTMTISGWRKSSSAKIPLCKNEYWEGRCPATRFQWEILSLAEKRENLKRKEEFMSGGVGPPFARIMIEFFRYKTLVVKVNV